jgi:hypothetical protein
MADKRRRGARVSPSARLPDPCALIGRSLRLLDMRRSSRTVAVGCSSPAPATNWRTDTVQPPACRGRYEGTERFLGRSEQRRSLGNRRHTGDRASLRVWCRHVLSVPADRTQVRTRDQMLTTPAPNKRKIFADRNRSSLDKKRPHKGSARELCGTLIVQALHQDRLGKDPLSNLLQLSQGLLLSRGFQRDERCIRPRIFKSL